MSEQTFVGEETEQPMRAVILPPQPPPHAVLQPDLLAAKQAGAMSVGVGIGPAAGDAIHPAQPQHPTTGLQRCDGDDPNGCVPRRHLGRTAG